MRFSIFRRSPTRLNWSRQVPSIDDFLTSINSLPAISESAIRVMTLAENDNFRFSDHLEALSGDPAMSLKLAELASKLTPRRIPCRTPERAFSVLGMEQANRLITYFALRSALSTTNDSLAEKIDAIWTKSVATAFLAKELNDEFRLGFQGIEFTAALLHDVGRIVLYLIDGEKAKRVESLSIKHGNIFDRERRLIGTDHGEIGAEYALRQNLPVRTRRVIRFHHDSLSPVNDERLLTDLVAAADEINPQSETPEKAQFALQRMLSREFSEFAEGFPERLSRLKVKAAMATRDFFGMFEERSSVKKAIGPN